MTTDGDSTDAERRRLSDVAEWYETDGFYAKLLAHGYTVLQEQFVGTSCLELGCADGAMTERLVEDFDRVVAVDGAEEYCSSVRDRIDADGLSVDCALFEEYDLDREFDTVVMAHVLEHLADPVAVLRRVREWVADDGRLVVVVPNGRSLHRQVGAEMGVISEPTEIDDHDERLGHRRVYTPAQVSEHVEEAGYDVRETGGIGLKPLTNDQMDELLEESIQMAYLSMGEQFPDIAAEQYVVASL